MELVKMVPGAPMIGSQRPFTAYIYKRTPPAGLAGFQSKATLGVLPTGKATRRGTQYGLTATARAQQAADADSKKATRKAKRQKKADNPSDAAAKSGGSASSRKGKGQERRR